MPFAARSAACTPFCAVKAPTMFFAPDSSPYLTIAGVAERAAASASAWLCRASSSLTSRPVMAAATIPDALVTSQVLERGMRLRKRRKSS